ncbi:Glyoxylase I 4 [Linum grandiflorum]
MEEIEEVRSYSSSRQALPLVSLNHVSLMCRSVWDSARFYQDVMGFLLIKRPSSFNFTGAWLYNYGIGIHLIENTALDAEFEPRPINPKDNHISFQVIRCMMSDLVDGLNHDF